MKISYEMIRIRQLKIRHYEFKSYNSNPISEIRYPKSEIQYPISEILKSRHFPRLDFPCYDEIQKIVPIV